MVKYLSKEDYKAIQEAIAAAEKKTSGEIRVHIRTKTQENILKHAEQIFKELNMHKTKQRNGVLILVDPKHCRFALFGDQGIHEEVGNVFWQSTRDVMESYFRKNEIMQGILQAVKSVGEELGRYFPLLHENPNELSNDVTEDK